MGMNRILQLVGWGYVAICAALVLGTPGAIGRGASAPWANTPPSAGGDPPGTVADADQWFRRMKPYCNSVEVGLVRNTPPPATWEGSGFQAACFALAGRTDDSRRVIDALRGDDRWRAAGIVFDVGHSVADAGDDRAAGPIMELVIDYWPTHYMALYHAAMAEYMLGQSALARRNLVEFLRLYQQNDGWRSNALVVLRRLDDSAGAAGPAAAELRRPREP